MAYAFNEDRSKANVYTKEEINVKTDAFDTRISNEENARFLADAEETADRISGDETLDARISAIASLEEGSTTGDAELIDARICYDGLTSASAGDAIRRQSENAALLAESNMETTILTRTGWNAGAGGATFWKYKAGFKKGRTYVVEVATEGWTPGSGGYNIILRTLASPSWNETDFQNIRIAATGTFTTEVGFKRIFTATKDELYIAAYMSSGSSFDLAITIKDATEDDVAESAFPIEVRLPKFRLFLKHVWSSEAQNYIYSNNCAVYLATKYPVKIKIVTDDKNADFSILDYDNNATLTEWVREGYIEPGKNIILEYRIYGGSDFNNSDAAKFHLFVESEADAKLLYEFFTKNIENIFSNSVTEDPDDYRFASIYYTIASKFGYINQYYGQSTPLKQQISWKWFRSDHDLLVAVNQYSNHIAHIINMDSTQELYTVNQGESVVVPAGTVFSVYFEGVSAHADHPANVVFAPIKPSATTNRALIFDSLNAALPSGQSLQSAFIDENGTFWNIDGDGRKKYRVYKNHSYVVSDGTITQNIGHANNCNYVGGKVYISAWMPAVKERLLVFNVDTVNYEMTYEKTIAFEIEDGENAAEYFMCDSNEYEVIAAIMTDNLSKIKIVLFAKNEDGDYMRVKTIAHIPLLDQSWGRWIQGFTVHNGFIYIIVGDATTYQHRGLIVVDMKSGMFWHLPKPATISTEIEAIFPIPNTPDMFYLVDGGGRIFTQQVHVPAQDW